MTAKDQRQRLITDWLRAQRVGSQDELVARLRSDGIAATQATVSRDLDEIGAIRVKRAGLVGYRLPQEPEPGVAAERLGRLLGEWVLDIIPAGAMIVLRTPPGSANLVANAIDQALLPEVAGTIAGDDTIFLALTDGVTPGSFAAVLRARRLAG